MTNFSSASLKGRNSGLSLSGHCSHGTNIGVDHAPDDVFFQVRQQFGEAELVNLTLAIVAINGWNRLAIAFRAVPGSYQVKTAG